MDLRTGLDAVAKRKTYLPMLRIRTTVFQPIA
jgi:hypothetical protein